MAIEAEAHVDLVHGNYPVHLLHRPVTSLTFDACVNVRLVRKANEVWQRVNPRPSNFEWLLRPVHPRRGQCR
jgi:hypothetical protein